MAGNFFKKIFLKSDDGENAGSKLGANLREKSAKLTQFLGDKFYSVGEEFSTIKKKCENLRETNYNLGLKHLENGHLSDAIFRFRFIKKFWPDLYDAYYQLAYCLVLNDEPRKAKEVLQELLVKKPDYDPKAQALLVHINSAIEHPSANA